MGRGLQRDEGKAASWGKHRAGEPRAGLVCKEIFESPSTDAAALEHFDGRCCRCAGGLTSPGTKSNRPLGCSLQSLLSKFVACGGNGGTGSTLAKTDQNAEDARMVESGLEHWGAFEPHSSTDLGDVASQNCIKRVGWCPVLP
ncbi:hypothetical protein LUU34_01469000 [Aix galericulata]|nr:hypothetical protein LUU34_01469000 [Aix galericulata]